MPKYLVCITNVELPEDESNQGQNPNLALARHITSRNREHAISYAAHLYARRYINGDMERASCVEAIVEGYNNNPDYRNEIISEYEPLVFSDADDGHPLRIMVVRCDTDVNEAVDIHA